MSDAAALFHVEDVLLVSIRDDIDDTDILDLQERLSESVARRDVQGVVIDISDLEIVDTFVGRVLGQLAKIAKLLAADTYIVGMRPAVAMTLVELGMTLPEMRTALNVTQAVRRLRESR
ncbi:STAS domain-containing protein [Parvularcula oceani]|uniref:STAS domain-containing protein n=1 Tax=Parvularcula oceani TaxID=1247963 RepID=UPI0004E233F5|nr:STAS domain-containing protein [Parvularcula oceani]